MSVSKTTIVVEDRFREIFNYLPKIQTSKGQFEVYFDGGDEKELNTFLKVKSAKRPYPLIWLVYPYEEKHDRTKVLLDSVTLILAVETNTEMLNRERLKTTYNNILLPLLDNIRKSLQLACIININDEYSVIKRPNYAGDDNGEEGKSIDIWDALEVSFSCYFNDSCLKPIKL